MSTTEIALYIFFLIVSFFIGRITGEMKYSIESIIAYSRLTVWVKSVLDVHNINNCDVDRIAKEIKEYSGWR